MLNSFQDSVTDYEWVWFNILINTQWQGGMLVRVLELRSVGYWFDSWPPCYQVHSWASCSHTCLLSPSSITLVPSASWEGNQSCGIAKTTVVFPSTGSRPWKGRWASRLRSGAVRSLYQHIIGHFQSITCTATDKQTSKTKRSNTGQHKISKHNQTGPSENT